jgi:hypothetical protein
MGVIKLLYPTYYYDAFDHDTVRAMRDRKTEEERRRIEAMPPIYVPFSEQTADLIEELRRLVIRKERAGRLKVATIFELARKLDIPVPSRFTRESEDRFVASTKQVVLDACSRMAAYDVSSDDEYRYATAVDSVGLVGTLGEAILEERASNDEAESILFRLGSIGAFDMTRNSPMLGFVSETRLDPLAKTIKDECRLAVELDGVEDGSASEHFCREAEAVAEFRLGVMLRNAFIERLVSEKYDIDADDFHERRARYIRRFDRIATRMSELAPVVVSGDPSDDERSEWNGLVFEWGLLSKEFSDDGAPASEG